MSTPIIKDIGDPRGMTDMGSAIFVKRAGASKYSLWLPVSDMPATGSAPDQVEKTVTSERNKSYNQGRKDPGQKEFTFMAHRDNFIILKGDFRKRLDFLQINPDGTGWKFQGYVDFYQDAITLGSNITGKGVITISHSDDLPIDNVTDIVEETVTFISAIDDIVRIKGTETATISVETDPADASVTATSETTTVATASYASGKVTITGVAQGSSIVKLTATKNGCANGVTHILVIVEPAS